MQEIGLDGEKMPGSGCETEEPHGGISDDGAVTGELDEQLQVSSREADEIPEDISDGRAVAKAPDDGAGREAEELQEPEKEVAVESHRDDEPDMFAVHVAFQPAYVDGGPAGGSGACTVADRVKAAIATRKTCKLITAARQKVDALTAGAVADNGSGIEPRRDSLDGKKLQVSSTGGIEPLASSLDGKKRYDGSAGEPELPEECVRRRWRPWVAWCMRDGELER